jgi:hypothetical protein
MPQRNRDTIERNIRLLQQGLDKLNRLGAQLNSCTNQVELERIRASIRRGRAAVEQFRRDNRL